MKTNLTLKLDADLVREVRILAAEQNTSISALLSERLQKMVLERRAYDRSRRRALARLQEGFDLGWKKPRSRDELHER
jgi:predicted transcriptional regulator